MSDDCKKKIIGNITLYNCDYREIITEIKADAIVTDPPYIIASNGSGIAAKRDYIKDIGSANIDKGFEMSVFDGFNHVVSFCSKAQIKNFIIYAEENGYSWRLLPWHKTNPTPLTNGVYLPDTEFIFHLWKNQKLGGNYETKKGYFLTQVEKNKFNHPTVKPVSIITTLILNATQSGQTIFDPFSGTGTTGVCALKSGRKAILCEVNPDYFEISCERVAMEFSQQDIFN